MKSMAFIIIYNTWKLCKIKKYKYKYMEINMDGFEFFFSMQLFKVEYKI